MIKRYTKIVLIAVYEKMLISGNIHAPFDSIFDAF